MVNNDLGAKHHVSTRNHLDLKPALREKLHYKFMAKQWESMTGLAISLERVAHGYTSWWLLLPASTQLS
jgi:hypothetical protein